MSTTQPIRSKQLLHDFKEYYLTKQPNSRNYTLILIGLNTALHPSSHLGRCLLHRTQPLLHPSPDHGEKNGKRNQNPDQQRTSGNITVLPKNTDFHSRHRLPLPQSQKS